MKIKAAVMSLTGFEWMLWLGSVGLIALSLLTGKKPDTSVLCACLVGATALIFVSKGEPLGQLLTIVFALLYGYISLRFRYYGEMITYLGMTAPMAVIALVNWLRNPFEQGKSQVRVAELTAKKVIWLVLLTALITFVFYFILEAFDTPNLFLSTVSIATSFSAVGLTMLRSPYYALAYAANDMVLIGLWVLAGQEDSEYWPMVMCFVIFLLNDAYGYYSWRRLRAVQQGMKDD